MADKVKVDLKKFENAPMFERYVKEIDPSVCVTGVVDITKLYKFKKKHSLNAMLCYCVMMAGENVKEFHYVTDKKDLYFYKHMKVNAVIKGSDKQFYYIDYPYTESFIEFEKEYERINKYCYENNCHNEIDTGAKLSTSAVIGYPFKSVNIGMSSDFWDNFLVWGKYEKHLFKVTLNITLRFNHATIAGEHAGMFYNELQKVIKNFKVK